MNTYIGYDDIKNRYPFSGIFSDVDINFHADDVSTVTSLTLDSIKDSRRSTEKLPTQINQLLVDIQSMDDGELARAYRTAKELKQSVEDIVFQERMPRFTTAFNRMFESLKRNNFRLIWKIVILINILYVLIYQSMGQLGYQKRADLKK